MKENELINCGNLKLTSTNNYNIELEYIMFISADKTIVELSTIKKIRGRLIGQVQHYIFIYLLD